MSKDILKEDKDLFTGKEIFGQPDLWKSVYHVIKTQQKGIDDFLTPILAKEKLKIILTGAGSSAFIGEATQGLIQKITAVSTQAIATTDIVTHPELFFLKNTPTLLISFARSGNSPESMEAVLLANQHCNTIYHLIITCNKDGELAQFCIQNDQNCYSIVLPEETNDKSLAMTGSFTSMALSALLSVDIKNIDHNATQVEEIATYGKEILRYKDQFRSVLTNEFKRVVFLGSGPMLGIARECHLKLQELTDGQVICKHDSFLGFRHGPRAVVDQDTLVVFLFSSDDHVLKYEEDLAIDISNDPRNIKTIAVGGESELKNSIHLPAIESNNILRIIPATIIGQLLGYYNSLMLGLDPDNPSISGAISRVVQGVKIYKR